MTELDRIIGRRIRARRGQRRWSQGQLAAAIGVSVQQISKYELAHCRVYASTLLRIAEALNCQPGDLMPPTLERGRA